MTRFEPGLNHMLPAGRRNTAPPGSFWVIFGPLEPRLRCATFVQSAILMVRPPAVAIRDLVDFCGSGGLGEISRPPGL